MDVVPFRWQGASRREKVAARVESRLRTWLTQWTGADSIALHVRQVELRQDEQDVERRANWMSARAAAGSLHLCATVDLEMATGGLLMGADPADAVDMATGIGRRALSDLIAQLLGTDARHESMPDEVGPPAAAIEPKCGVVGLECSLGGIRFGLYLDAALCDRIVPVEEAGSHDLVRREIAVLPCDVKLQAVLGLGHLSLSDVSDLVPGEIIKTDVRLDATVDVMAGTKRVFSGALMALEGHRALRCTTTLEGGM